MVGLGGVGGGGRGALGGGGLGSHSCIYTRCSVHTAHTRSGPSTAAPHGPSSLLPKTQQEPCCRVEKWESHEARGSVAGCTGKPATPWRPPPLERDGLRSSPPGDQDLPARPRGPPGHLHLITSCNPLILYCIIIALPLLQVRTLSFRKPDSFAYGHFNSSLKIRLYYDYNFWQMGLPRVPGPPGCGLHAPTASIAVFPGAASCQFQRPRP